VLGTGRHRSLKLPYLSTTIRPIDISSQIDISFQMIYITHMIELKLDPLFDAVEIQVAIELRHLEKQEENYVFFSKFLACEFEEQSILIRFPIASEALHVLREEDPLTVKFIHTDSPFIFSSRVKGFRQYQSPGEETEKVMEIELPETIMGEERRNFLKLSTPPFMTNVKVLESADMAKKIRTRNYKSMTLNISGGGIAIENYVQDLPLAKGDILALDIDLPNAPVYIEGEVLNVYTFEGSIKSGYGIRFIEKNLDRLQFKKAVTLISKYVLKRERELLSRH